MRTGGLPLISVVIPSYNDRDIIVPFFRAIIDVLNSQSEFDFELIYVDDGSSDGSQVVLRELAEENPRVVFVEFFRNFGQQRALFAGLSQARGDYVVCLDGDYQYDPSVIIRLVRAMADGFDMASGIRVGKAVGAIDRLTSAIGNHLINKAMSVQLRDFGSVKAFSRTLINEILSREHFFSDVYPTALFLRPNIVEVEVEHRRRYSGKSHWNFWMRLKLYLDLYISYRDDTFHDFFKFGVLTCMGSAAVFLILSTIKTIWSYQATYAQIGAIAFTVFLAGIGMTGWSLLMSVAVKIFRQNMARSPFIIRHVHDNRAPSRTRKAVETS